MKTVGHSKSIIKINKRTATIVTFVIILIITITITAASGLTNFFKSIETNNSDQNTTHDIDNKTSSDDKKDFIENQANSTPPTITADNVSFQANKETNGSTTIETTLKDVSDGTCDIKIKSSNKEYNQSVAILYQPSFSTCTGFSIPAGELPDGLWNITLSVTSKNKTVTKTIDIEVK